MKKLTLTFLTILFCLTSSVVWSKTVSDDDLVERNGLLFKKFKEVPFSGQVIAYSPVEPRRIGPCHYSYDYISKHFVPKGICWDVAIGDLCWEGKDSFWLPDLVAGGGFVQGPTIIRHV